MLKQLFVALITVGLVGGVALASDDFQTFDYDKQIQQRRVVVVEAGSMDIRGNMNLKAQYTNSGRNYRQIQGRYWLDRSPFTNLVVPCPCNCK